MGALFLSNPPSQKVDSLRRTGQIISEGTTISIYYPGIQHIRLDNLMAEVIEKGSDWLKIYVPAGNHHLQIGSPYIGLLLR